MAGDSALDRRSRPAREREGERTEGGQERLARGQEDRRMPPTTPTITDKQQAASALPSSAAQTSSVYYQDQVTRTLVVFIKHTSSSSHSSLLDAPCLGINSFKSKTFLCFVYSTGILLVLDSMGCTHKKKLLQIS